VSTYVCGIYIYVYIYIYRRRRAHRVFKVLGERIDRRLLGPLYHGELSGRLRLSHFLLQVCRRRAYSYNVHVNMCVCVYIYIYNIYVNSCSCVCVCVQICVCVYTREDEEEGLFLLAAFLAYNMLATR